MKERRRPSLRPLLDDIEKFLIWNVEINALFVSINEKIFVIYCLVFQRLLG
jgi:hypothetical protein